MNRINKLILSLILVSIAIASLGFASAADMNETYVTDFELEEEYVDVENTDSDEELYCVSPSMPDDVESVDDECENADFSADEEVQENTNASLDGENNETRPIVGPKIVVNNDSGNSSKSPKIGPYVDSGNQTIPVSINTPGTFEDLQSLIDNAKEGSTLYLTRDYYGHEGAKITINKNLIINGLGYAIDCRGAKNCIGFISLFGDVTLRNLNILNGNNDDGAKGGAICILGFARYTLINCKFINNWADDYGGAIYNGASNPLTIKNCVFRGNTADDCDGGAIYSKGEVNIEGSQFENNKAYVDGGAVKSESNVNVFNSSFISNSAKGANSQCYGGAICSKADVYVDNCIFKENLAQDYGGAIYAKNIHINTKQSSKSSFISNKAEDNDGGALYAEEKVNGDNVEFNYNSAYEDGGAVFCKDADFKNALFSSNTAKGAKIADCYGGAIFAKETVNLYKNCEFRYNYAEDLSGAIKAKNLNLWDKSIKFWGNDIGKRDPWYCEYVSYGGICFENYNEVTAHVHKLF